MATVLSFLAVIVCYFLGSIPPSYVIGRVFYNVDIRKHGSGNVGGANAGRLFGYKIMVFVGLFDILKGTAAVLLMKWVSANNLALTGFFSIQENFIILGAFMAVIGHCYSVWLGFSGGKGGATTAGVILAISPISFLILIVYWVLIVGTTRFTSLGNLLGVLAIIPLMAIFTDNDAYTILAISLTALIFWTHRANVGRLMKGEERKLGNRETIEEKE